MSLTRAEKLELDAIVAPLVRSKHLGGNPINRRRPVHVYDPDTLVVTRTIPLSEATEGILATAKIELAVDEGVRPKTILCEVCGNRCVNKTGARWHGASHLPPAPRQGPLRLRGTAEKGV